ncbi:MAG: hypothetical protein WKF86_03055 [Acidimicrobiales bacterium]
MSTRAGSDDESQPEPVVGYGHRDPAEAVGDHAMGLELQLVEVVEQIKRAAVQERWDDLRALRAEEARLEADLARTAETAITLPE